MAINSSHVIFCQESWNLKHKLKVEGQHVGLNFGTAQEISSKKYKYIFRNGFEFKNFILSSDVLDTTIIIFIFFFIDLNHAGLQS